MDLGSVTSYNLLALESALEQAASSVAFEDLRLTLAIDYYQQALLLFGSRRLISDPLFRQHSMLISAAFLNLWKAISSIVGDPSIDNDYQSRYRNLGFDYEFFQEHIEKVRELRNDFDIAHYSLEIEDLKAVEEQFGEASQIAQEVLKRYRESLSAT